MSMNYSEFKKLILADPWSQAPEVLEARQSSAGFEQAAVEAQTLARSIEAAVNVPVPADLLDSIKAIAHPPRRQRSWVSWALAASILVAVGTVSIIWKQSHQWNSVQDYLAEHYAYDGHTFLSEAGDTVPGPEVSKMMASLNATAGQQLVGKVKFIKYCPTPDGRGIHMVVSTADGPMTIIFMPNTQVTDGEMVEFGQEHAYVVNLEHGSDAIIGRKEQPVQSLQALVRRAIIPLQAGA
jgi:hypothetical protein